MPPEVILKSITNCLDILIGCLFAAAVAIRLAIRLREQVARYDDAIVDKNIDAAIIDDGSRLRILCFEKCIKDILNFGIFLEYQLF